MLLNLSDLEILTTYSAELRGFYNYYCLAENVSKEMWKLRHVMRLSCLKTLASKHRTTVKHILDKFRIDNNNWGIEYKVKDSVRIRHFYNEGFKIKTSTQERNLDVIPNIVKYSGRSKLEDRMNANCCELCGKDFGEFDVHHKHQIKDLNDKTYWKQIMIAKQRKVLVLCKDCHIKVHFGA